MTKPPPTLAILPFGELGMQGEPQCCAREPRHGGLVVLKSHTRHPVTRTYVTTIYKDLV